MTKTLENLAKAFVGESQARNRYTMYSKVAKKEGFEQIAAIFLETADQEREHAAQLFKMINALQLEAGETAKELSIPAGVPTVYATTKENLTAAIGGENYEYTAMYPEFAATAAEEGLSQVAARLRSIGKAEEHHEERYKKLLVEVEAGTVFEKETEVWWYCRECGYMHFGKRPPEKCPACDHEKAYYQVKSEQY
jgi:rubrerythrin